MIENRSTEEAEMEKEEIDQVAIESHLTEMTKSLLVTENRSIEKVEMAKEEIDQVAIENRSIGMSVMNVNLMKTDQKNSIKKHLKNRKKELFRM